MEASQVVQPLVQDSVQESSQDIVQCSMPRLTDELYRLVIVEDDTMIYKTLKHIIGRHFPNVHIVGHCVSVVEFVSLVGAEKPDIVLLDIQLRGGTSFQGLAELQERNFDSIVMSAQAQFHYAQEAMRYGASEYLVKPFLPEDLIVALEVVIAKRRARDLPNGIEVQPANAILALNEQKKTTPLRAIIVDDEKSQRAVLTTKITEIFHERITIAAEAFSVDSAILAIHDTSPDIVFLDIDIVGGTGFDVLQAFPDRTFEVIFVSSHPHFAPQAFRYDALDFIVKPIDPEHLAQAIERTFARRGINKGRYTDTSASLAENTEKKSGEKVGSAIESSAIESSTTENGAKESGSQESSESQMDVVDPEQFTPSAKKGTISLGYWAFKATDKALYSLAWDQIIHLKADGKKTIIYHTQGKPLTVAKTIQKCLEDLPDTLFYQTHRSSAINRKHFSHARDGFAFMSNGDRVDVSTRIWAQFVADMIKNDRL